MAQNIDATIERAAEAISEADALLIGAGAGMGVDSGLPDFRGDEGFWESYPPFRQRGLDFYDLANPRWFRDDPELAWGFYGHRLHLYRRTDPHAGFDRLREWADRFDLSTFVFTSNVDGQFQKAGFTDEQILECHGSIHHLQCAQPCRQTIWPADAVEVAVDEETFRAEPPLPECSRCGRVARPNVLMFGDMAWEGGRTGDQKRRFRQWLNERGGSERVVVIESGAGTAVPTVRRQCEQVAARSNGRLIRINPREAQAPADALSVPAGALKALRAIDEQLT